MKFVFLSHLDLNLFLFRLPIMQALIARGHEAIALCPRGDVFDRFAEHGVTAVDYDVDRSSLNPLREYPVILHLASLLRQHRPDVLHTFTAKPNIYGTLAGRMARVPVIYNLVEGLGSFYVEDSLRNRCVRVCMEGLYAISCRLSDSTVFVNRDDADHFRSHRLVPQAKMRIIRSVGIDTQMFSPEIYDASSVRRELGLASASRVVLMVARAIWHKGLAEYIGAARMLRIQYPDAVFLLAGDVDLGNPSSASREYLLNQPHVRWLGPRTDIAELTALCDVYVLPSYREGVPRTLLEAASMAKPIVTTDTVGCREVVEDRINGILVPVRDSEALSRGIATLLDDPALRERMGRAGREKAVREFDVRHVVQQYLELYGVS
ncbi:glycosyltransferase family 4 protein [Desulfomicrobium escambiense]|uniref:glycosyltransferase family 4 protein n=1 Tax=Desulfomicrobium escambiense TaxID=29503 RepID=UPI00048A53AD|nr:glycosyltransferase family 4 protein [Desulfomicrobium escambiense]